ncbi:hypothetical protein NPIL_180881 [Nephila pilipes]|uniref:Uncharacterized protein n=1 Tax=Nephila pilipes TaxID=299642 RepID=A0A8X6N331_NEPPI|nr:hypothetical protein NPIL_180881 [Nephila pilipes]
MKSLIVNVCPTSIINASCAIVHDFELGYLTLQSRKHAKIKVKVVRFQCPGQKSRNRYVRASFSPVGGRHWPSGRNVPFFLTLRKHHFELTDRITFSY